MYQEKAVMTEISGNNMGFIGGGERSPEELVEFLKEGAMFRRFDETLKKAYPNDDILPRLSSGLAAISGEPLPGVTRKVHNWLNGKNAPKNREALFQICFVLGISEADASKLLGTASETGLHYRNPVELVYAFGLRLGMGYAEAVALKEKILGKYQFTPVPQPEGTGDAAYTRQVRDAFSQVSNEEELMAFFDAHFKELGQLHETAYRKFMELMNLLQEPVGMNGGKERRYTVEEVMDTYMRMNVPETKKTEGCTLIQKMVKKYWPNESSLLDMINRREDVSRKALILLYLVTEEFGGEDDEDDADTSLEVRIKLMDLFLDRYGMNVLDPGNPFDLLVIYAMGAQEGEYMSDRMEAVIGELFMA